MATSRETVCEAIKQSLAHLSRQRGYDVHPESHACGFVTGKALDILGSRSNAEDVQFELPDTTTHHVLRVLDETPQVFDGQFKQFVPSELRETLPDILVIDLNQPQEQLQSILESMGMQSDIAEAYAHAVTQ